MNTTRRSFLATGLSAGAAVPLLGQKPSLLEAASSGGGAPEDHILVVLQINGGWDGLNILAEVDHPKYAVARPGIGLPKSSVYAIQSGAKHYWHPSMLPFRDLFDRGDLAVIENVGYPSPNLSHFTSEKKWYAGDPGVSAVDKGWLSNYLTRGYSGTFSIPAINLGSRLNDSFYGSGIPVFQRTEDYQFRFDDNYYAQLDDGVQLEALRKNGGAVRTGAPAGVKFVGDCAVSAIRDTQLLQALGSSYTPRASYPGGSLARTLQTVSSYITGGLETQVYYTRAGSFDTHANQAESGNPLAGGYANQLYTISASIAAFLDDLRAYGKHQKVVVMVFSEFGRRFGENGSLGTDHGHGGISFLAGEPVKGGRYGTPPDLDAATTPYSRYYIPFDNNSTDFRSMYATVIQNWLGADHATVLGNTFPLLGAL